MNQYKKELDDAKQFSTITTDLNYHPLTTQIYPANWLDTASEFEKYKMGEFSRLNEDNCYNQRKDTDNGKKLKFITTNYVDLLQGKQDLNFFGIGVRDQLFVPADNIDTYSDLLNGKNGGQLTNEKFKHSFGQLPLPTAPYRGQIQHGDVIIEDSIRNYIEVKKKACLPLDDKFEIRSFSIFDTKQNIEMPDPNKSVEQVGNGFNLGRNGIPSRFQNRFETQKKFESSNTVLSNLQGANISNY